METSDSIADLIERFEEDVRFGCGSTFIEASRSVAGKELEKRSKNDVITLLHYRWTAMNEQMLNPVEKGVHVAITMLIQWIEQK